jgi:hypothetical protein
MTIATEQNTSAQTACAVSLSAFRNAGVPMIWNRVTKTSDRVV